MGKKKRLKRTKGKSKKEIAAPPKNTRQPFPDLMEGLSSFLNAHQAVYYLVPIGLFFVVGLLLFDPTIEPMQDDADYIMAPVKLVEQGVYPSYHSVFYTVIMAVPALIFGISIIGYKVMSLLFNFVALLIMLHYLKRYFNQAILWFVCIVFSTNFAIQFYSSSVMSESFFFMMQAIALISSLHLIFLATKSDDSFFSSIPAVLLASTSMFLLSITKNLALVSIIAVILALLFQKKAKLSLSVICVFVAIRFVYSQLIALLFDTNSVSGQFSTLLQKDFYDASKGNEDLIGLINRYFINLDYHLSSDLLRIFGFREQTWGLESIPLLTVAITAILVLLLITTFRNKNKETLFLGLYLFITMSVVFVSLQTHWKQDRMIIIFIPLLLLFLWQSLYYLSKINVVYGNVILVVIVFLSAIQLRHLPQAIEDNRIEFVNQRNTFEVPHLERYTPDWQNYLLMSQWSEDNLPDSAKIGVRKVNTSKVISGGSDKFVGFGTSTREPGEIVYNDLKGREITHIMACNLRLNPAQAVEGQIIGTLYSYLRAIYNYDPTKLRVVHRIGDTEPCTLYEIL